MPKSLLFQRLALPTSPATTPNPVPPRLYVSAWSPEDTLLPPWFPCYLPFCEPQALRTRTLSQSWRFAGPSEPQPGALKIEYGGGGEMGGFGGRGSEPKGVEGVCPPSPRWGEFASSVLSRCGFRCPSPSRSWGRLTSHWF